MTAKSQEETTLLVHAPEVTSEARFNTADIVSVGVTAFERDVEEAAAQIKLKVDETNARIRELTETRAKLLQQSQDEAVEAQKKTVMEAAKLMGLNGRPVASGRSVIHNTTRPGDDDDDMSEDVRVLSFDVQVTFTLDGCTKKMCNNRARPFSLTLSIPGRYPDDILAIRQELQTLNGLLTELNAAYVECRSKLDPGALSKLSRVLTSSLVEEELAQSEKGKRLLETLQNQHGMRVKKLADKVDELTGRTTKLLGGPSSKKKK